MTKVRYITGGGYEDLKGQRQNETLNIPEQAKKSLKRGNAQTYF